MNKKEFGKTLVKVGTKQKAFLAVIVMFIIMLFFPTNFYTFYNLMDILNSTAVNEILAAGVTLTIICGACDLSIGGILCLSGIVTIMLMNSMPMVFAILCSIALGALIGFINGFFVVRQKTEPFIITLGMGMLLKGVCLQLTNAHPVSPTSPDFMFLANGRLFNAVPYLVIIMAVVLIFTHWLLRYTEFGRNCYAIGGDYEVAVYSGINAMRTKWITFVISGITAALGGVMLSSKLNSGSSIYGDTTALVVNCGAVVGGTSFAGGIGGIPQTFIGLLALGVLQNCLNMLGIASYIQMILQGLVIVGIIWLDCYGMKRKREAV